MTERELLFNSVSLTDEEEKLREELLAWIVQKAEAGHRPIPLSYALRIMADFAGGWNGGQQFWENVRRSRNQPNG